MPNMIKKSLTVSNGNEVVINCHNFFTVADETKHFIQCLLCMYSVHIDSYFCSTRQSSSFLPSPKLYIPSTLNNDYLLCWHAQLIVCVHTA